MGTEDESLTNVNKFLSRLHYIFINLDKSHHLLKDIKDEIGILKEFFRLHNGKIEKIRVYVTAWEKGIIKDLQEDVVDVIYKLNKKISPALSRLIRLEDRDLIILKVITASRGVQRRKIPKQFILKLKDLFTKLEDNIKFLRSIIAKQNEYIRNNNLWGGRLVQEIEKHAGFYMLLATESNTDNTIRQILGNITEFIDEEFRLQERFKISEHRFTEEILNPSSLAFTKYYEDLYSKSFPKEELDSKTWLGTYARVSYQLKHILEHHSRTHLIVIKQGEQIVGGILVEFLSVKVEQIIEALRKKNRFSEMVSTAVIKEIGSTKEKIGFGVIWYTITEKESRLKGIGSTLVEHAKKILKNDAILLGYKLRGIFCEINSPRLMNEEQIKEDILISMNPNERLIFWRKRGMKTVKCKYIQPEFEGCASCDYLYLRCWTDDPKWRNAIPICEYLPVMYNFMKDGIGLDVPEENNDFLKIIYGVKDRKQIQLIDIDDFTN